ncbi:MAG: hypothetical protein JWP37_3645 [Mucilaginibacter sp.]|nr:hypothetical protein [Mucilaginibacter sp.]
MSLQKINLRNSILILMIIIASAARLININHLTGWGNFTPVGAMALFGGAYFSDKWKAYLVPLFALFISDIALDYIYFGKFMLFYSGALPVYASFAIMVFIGTYIKKVNVANVVLGSLGAVLVHWLITDIDPWLQGTMYARSFYGYGESLIAAIPFEKSMLLGNLIYGAVLFGGFELAKSKFEVLRVGKEIAV